MKIVIAPDSFKESLSASKVADAIERGFRQILPDAEYVKVPVADGGEGTVLALVDGCKGEIISCNVIGPMAEKVEAFYGLIDNGKTAVIEMSSASGLHLVKVADRNPLLASSFGTGELILDAIVKGVTKIILGLGGSATNDGGAGMMSALGVRFLSNNKLVSNINGESLIYIDEIDLSSLNSKLTEINFEVACDVDNPLCGNLGASVVFGEQKGANDEMIKTLDTGLAHYANLIKTQLNRDIVNVKGAGAAGGMGGAMIAFFNAEMRPGIDIVMKAVNLVDKLKNADLVITGEGRIDKQTIYGKTPIGIAKMAKRSGCNVIGIAGCITEDSSVVHEHGLDAIFSIMPSPMSIKNALETTTANLIQCSRNIAAVYTLK